MWPDSNVGVVTGSRSRLLVLDVDIERGGDVALAALEREHGVLPATVEAVSGSGGRHIWFKHPGGDLRGGCDRLTSGVDVCADGQFLVAPVSLHMSGRTYEWEVSGHPDEVPLAPLPEWVVAVMSGHGNARSESGASVARTSTSSAPRRVHRIPEGRRNGTLTRMAGSMVRAGFAPEAVKAGLRAKHRAL